MPTFQTYNVTPILPATLEPLREMVFNLWWTWDPRPAAFSVISIRSFGIGRTIIPFGAATLAPGPSRRCRAGQKFFTRTQGSARGLRHYLEQKDTYGKTGKERVREAGRLFFVEFGSMNRFRITPAALAFSLEIIASQPAIST